MREDTLLRAAAVLFGRAAQLEADYPQCMLRVARFRSVDRTEFLDNRHFTATLFTYSGKRNDFLGRRFRWPDASYPTCSSA